MTRTSTGSAAIVLLLALCSSGTSGCESCRERAAPAQPPLATVYELRGVNARRDYAQTREHWEPLDVRAQFRLGDALRTDQPSSAILDLADGAQLNVHTGTLIRFLVDGARPGEQMFDLVTGDALLSTGAREVRLRTHVGLAVLAPGSRVELTRQGNALRLQLAIGEASFRDPGGNLQKIGPGSDVVLELGMAVLRAPNDAGAPQEPAAAAETADAGSPGPTAEADQRELMPSPKFSNLDAQAGESFVVHAPEVPIALGFDSARKCKADAIIELQPGRQRWRGTGRINVSLPAGSRSYTLRCIDARATPGSVVARGVVQVLHDSGTRKLPPRAPTSEIDADGRSYTIFYQNQLPNVRLSWPNAPKASSYQLGVDGTSMSVPSAEHLFQSGSLRDGTHQLSFEAQGRRSRTAAVTVRFDNTTATASLSAPVDRGFGSGDNVTIEGVALPAWKVSLLGGTIESVGDDRFRGHVVTSPEHPDIAVRLVHPRLGTHYYLRRAAGSQ